MMSVQQNKENGAVVVVPVAVCVILVLVMVVSVMVVPVVVNVVVVHVVVVGVVVLSVVLVSVMLVVVSVVVVHVVLVTVVSVVVFVEILPVCIQGKLNADQMSFSSNSPVCDSLDGSSKENQLVRATTAQIRETRMIPCFHLPETCPLKSPGASASPSVLWSCSLSPQDSSSSAAKESRNSASTGEYVQPLAIKLLIPGKA
mmetsp:Transcript_89262/g.158308  ORF Transcript_89262/g.158308 Transcript_89262/m.158308 type:complete len:201 (+) Transcript_89262:796-1398(+)